MKRWGDNHPLVARYTLFSVVLAFCVGFCLGVLV